MPLEFPPELTADIPPETLSDPSIQRYNSVGELVKSHIELNKYQGRSIALPNGESKPEEFEKWAGEQSAKLKDKGYAISKIGEPLPADPNGYQFKFEGVDDAKVANDKVLNMFKPVAHKMGLSNSKAQELAEWFRTQVAPEIMEKPREYLTGEAVKAQFKKEFEANPQFQEDYNRVISHLQISDPDVKDLLNETISFGKDKEISLGDHPAIVRIFARAAPLLMQDFGGNMGGGTPANQQDMIKEAHDIMNNPSNSKHELYTKGDPETHKYIQELFAKAYPGNITI